MSRRGQIVKKAGQEHRQKLASLIKEAAYMHATWQIWDNLMYMAAASLSQPVHWVQEREDEYLRRIGRYDKKTQDMFVQMFAEIILAFEQEGCVDILGDLYMQLELYNKWKGQFFTPSHICDMMAKITETDLPALVEKQGHITVNDPCCGGGAMLIAFAKNALEMGINYQTDVLFVGQDIDPVVARMCYISMSLLAMPGYVIIGNSLLHPPTAPMPADYDIWYTPLYFIHGFSWRRQRAETSEAVAELTTRQDASEVIDTETPAYSETPVQPAAGPVTLTIEYNEDRVGQLSLF